MPRLTLVGAALAVAAVLTTPSTMSVEGATLNVCPSGCTYNKPSAANSAMKAGDTMMIQPGTYTDCFSLMVDDALILGVLDAKGTRPTITGKVCGTKGAIVTYGKRATIKNLELSYANCKDGVNDNCAGIRHDGSSFDLTLDNMWIHHNDDGLLGSAKGDTITITNSIFEYNGYKGQAHNMYFGNHANVIFRNSISRHAVGSGHEFKTRALRTEIDQSIIATMGTSADPAKDSRLIDCSNGGVLIITNSILEKTAYSDNSDWVSYAPEGLSNSAATSLTFTNNIVINDRGTVSACLNMQWAGKPSSVTINNNTIVAMTAGQFNNYGTATNTIVYGSRTAAGYQAFPYLPALPKLPAGGSGGGNNGGGGTTPSNPTARASSTGPAKPVTPPANPTRRASSSTGPARNGGGESNGGGQGANAAKAAHLRVAFNMNLDAATDAWKTTVASATCTAIKLPTSRCSVIKVEAGSVVATVQITGPGAADTAGTSVSVDDAVTSIKSQFSDSTSALRKSSAYTNADTSRAVTSATVTQCSDGSFQDPCPSGTVSAVNAASSAMQPTMFAAAVLAVAALFAGAM